MLIESGRARRPAERAASRPLPPYLVIAILALAFAAVTLCALLLLILAWETVGWVRYRLTIETIVCVFAAALTFYNLANGKVRR